MDVFECSRAPKLTSLLLADIPGLNTIVMKHASITWELVVPVIAVTLFILLVEAWKLGKRVFYRRLAKTHPEDDPESSGIFAAWATQEVTNTNTKDRTVVV